MARRSDHTQEELRSIVIKAGCELMSEIGFSGFSTRKIAKEIGYTVGTLYNIFESYDDILLHINAATLDDMREFIEVNIDSKLKNEKAVKQIAKLYIDFAHKNYNRWSALFEYSYPAELDLPQWYKRKIEKLFGIVMRLLVEFTPKKSESLKHAKVIWASLHGICILSLTKKLDAVGVRSAEALTDSLIKNYLRGLKK